VYIGDCALPFVVLHNEVTLRPRSFVKVAVRFVPVSGKSVTHRAADTIPLVEVPT
jgi:hypothetical protein